MSGEHGYRYGDSHRRVTGARWAYDDEIRSSLTPVDLTADAYPACGMPLISDGRTAYVDGTDSHSLILGSTGSKKTRLFVMPTMSIIARAGESVVCTDPKGELYERTSGLFAREGYRILVLNLRDPEHSNGWNPLAAAQDCQRAGDAERAAGMLNDLAVTLFSGTVSDKDPFWGYAASSMFTGLAAMLVEGHADFPRELCSFAMVRRLAENLTNLNRRVPGPTNQLMDLYGLDTLAVSSLRNVVVAPDNTFNSILACYNVPMRSLYAQDSLVRMLSTPEVDFTTLGDRKTALYLIMPDEKTTLHGIVSLMIKQCYESLIFAAQQRPDKRLPVRVNFLLDEFANLPAIPDMNAMISAARSRNIRFFLVVQAMNQLRARYGEDAETIRSNCGNWVYLTSRELALLEELVNLCGQNVATGEALISVSQLQRLNKDTGETLVMCGRNYPCISHLADIDDYPFPALPPEPLPSLKTPRGGLVLPDMERLTRFLMSRHDL